MGAWFINLKFRICFKLDEKEILINIVNYYHLTFYLMCSSIPACDLSELEGLDISHKKITEETKPFHLYSVQFSSVQSLSCVRLFATSLLQHSRPPWASPTPRVHSNSCPSRQWCPPAISSSVIFFFSSPNPFQHPSLFQWVNSLHEVAKVLELQLQHQFPKNTQDWSLEWSSWISLKSKGLSRVFSNITVQKHQFFGAQLSSQSNSHIHTWPQEKP